MLGNILILLVIAAAWYVAFSRMDKTGEGKGLRLGVLIFLAVAFAAVFLATLGFCPAQTTAVHKAIP